MKILFALGLALLSTSAFAYEEGELHCKSSVGMPDNVYKIETVQLAAGVSLPYIEVTRSYRKEPSNPDSPITEAKVRGFAVVSNQGNSEILSLNALRFEFIDGKLSNCRR